MTLALLSFLSRSDRKEAKLISPRQMMTEKVFVEKLPTEISTPAVISSEKRQKINSVWGKNKFIRREDNQKVGLYVKRYAKLDFSNSSNDIRHPRSFPAAACACFLVKNLKSNLSWVSFFWYKQLWFYCCFAPYHDSWAFSPAHIHRMKMLKKLFFPFEKVHCSSLCVCSRICDDKYLRFL